MVERSKSMNTQKSSSPELTRRNFLKTTSTLAAARLAFAGRFRGQATTR